MRGNHFQHCFLSSSYLSIFAINPLLFIICTHWSVVYSFNVFRNFCYLLGWYLLTEFDVNIRELIGISTLIHLVDNFIWPNLNWNFLVSKNDGFYAKTDRLICVLPAPLFLPPVKWNRCCFLCSTSSMTQPFCSLEALFIAFLKLKLISG